MSSDKNLGTASCDLPSPTDVIAASLSKWLSLNDKDGSRAGKLRVISVDMDGTIADTRDRQRFAEEKSGVGPKPVKGVDGAPFFNVFLRGEYYSMDSPIPGAAEFLQQYIAPPTSGLIVYLSGRRQGTEGESRAWCRQHGFPDGIIVHRAKGMNSQRFKADFLLAIKASPLVRALDAHVGDRESDDGGAAAAAGVRFMHILHETGDGGPAPKPWPPFNDIALFGGP